MKTVDELSNMKERVVLISGGAGHLGTAIATALAEKGASIVVLDIDSDKSNHAAKALKDQFGGKHLAIAIDLSSKNEIASIPETIHQEFGKLDVLVNCAALVGSTENKGWAVSFEEQDVNTWEKALSVNLTAPFYLIQCCLDLLRKSKSASILNIGSIYGVAGQKLSMYEGLDYITPAAYSTSKGGINQLTVYLATVLAPKIRVNTISPGGIERGQDQKFQDRYNALTPLGRMATEEDFKGAALFLASDLSKYVTGQNIIVDGGWSL